MSPKDSSPADVIRRLHAISHERAANMAEAERLDSEADSLRAVLAPAFEIGARTSVKVHHWRYDDALAEISRTERGLNISFSGIKDILSLEWPEAVLAEVVPEPIDEAPIDIEFEITPDNGEILKPAFMTLEEHEREAAARGNPGVIEYGSPEFRVPDEESGKHGDAPILSMMASNWNAKPDADDDEVGF